MSPPLPKALAVQPLLIVALLCASATPRPDCTRATALDVVSHPASSAVPTACLIEGEATLARLAPRPETYAVIRCERRRG